MIHSTSPPASGMVEYERTTSVKVAAATMALPARPNIANRGNAALPRVVDNRRSRGPVSGHRRQRRVMVCGADPRQHRHGKAGQRRQIDLPAAEQEPSEQQACEHQAKVDRQHQHQLAVRAGAGPAQRGGQRRAAEQQRCPEMPG